MRNDAQHKYSQIPKTMRERFSDKYTPEPMSGCWLWTSMINLKGYGRMHMHKKFKPRWIRAHRASWIIHYGDIPKGMHVLHRCDTPACVNPEHLFIGTNQDNIEDKMRKGRHTPRGIAKSSLDKSNGVS